MRLALVFASRDGHTLKIAQYLASELRARGHAVEVFDAAQPRDAPRLAEYDGALLGACVHAGHHLRALSRFARQHRAELQAMPAGFFSVSMAAASQQHQDRQRGEQYMATFGRETGWTPALSTSFAGALPFRRYGFFKRLLMSWIGRSQGMAVDTSRDYEFTDWGAVERFAGQFLAFLGAAGTAPGASAPPPAPP